MKKVRFLRIFEIIVLFIVVIGVSQTVSAATVYDSSSDDSFATANRIDMGDTASGRITESDDLDYYQFSLQSAGCVTLNMTSYMQYYCIRVYDSDGEEIWYTDDNKWTESIGYRRDAYKLYLEKGTYYMQVNGYRYGKSDKSTGKYECSISFLSSGVNNVESDNSFFTATNAVLGNALTGQISENDDYDTYQFTLSQVGCVTLNMTSYMTYYCIRVYDSDGEEVWYTDDNEWTESIGYRRDAYKLYLEKGTYYMQVNGYRYGKSDKSTGKYVCNTSFQASNVSFDGDDNSFANAKSIAWSKKYTGQISINDDYDTYQFTVPSKKYVTVGITSYMQYYCIRLYKKNGEEIWYTDENEWNSKVSYRKDTYNVKLSAGTYYMQVNGYYHGDWNKSTGKYVFSLANLSQKNCVHEYSEKTVDATYFRRGYVSHKCNKCGKTYKDQYTDKRQLGQGYLSTYSSYAGKGKLVLSWYTVSDASGYQIRYCKSKAMKKGVKIIKIKGRTKSKKTIKKLSRRKKYYVQIRAYRQSGKQIVYGKWSAKMRLKTK